MKKVLLFLVLVLSSLMASAQNEPELVCSTPYIAALPLDATSSVIIWNSTAAASYTLEYRSCSESTWTTVNNLTAGTGTRDTGRYVIQNLVSCKCYVVRLRANCSANEVSDWKTSEFRTAGCVEPCRAPSGLFAAARETMASLNWSAGVAGSVYTVQWKLASSVDWKTQTTTTNSLIINELLPCNIYEFKVKSSCSNTATSEFSVSAKFKTSGCVAPCSTPRELRAVATTDRSSVYFKWVSTGARAYEVMYTAGDSAARTVTVTTTFLQLLNVVSCKTYKFKVRSICSSSTSTSPIYSEWSADISVNTEGCARCPTPSSLSVTATDGGASLKWGAIAGSLSYDIQWMGPNDTEWRTISGVRENTYRLTGLAVCSVYAYRVKANCTATLSSVWSAPMRFKTLGCAAVCAVPRDVRVYISDSVAVISWIGAAATVSYKLIVIAEDGTVVREVPVTGNSYTVTGLARCKKYKVQLKAVCSTTSVSEIVTTSFETRGCVSPCGVPREVAVQADSNKAILKWSNVGATKYYIEYKSSADLTTDWKRDSSAGNALILSNLTPCKVYYFRIAAVCVNGVSAFTEPYRFTTLGCQSVCEKPTTLGSEIVNDTTASVKFNVIPGQSYTVQYRVAGTAVWTSIVLNTATPNNLPVRITGLLKCTYYEWRVLRNCSATSVVESNSEKFKTLGCPTTTCERTVGLASDIVNDTTAIVKFTVVDGQNYTVQYRVAGTTAWTSMVLHAATVSNLPVRISHLLKCTYYEWRVLRNCSTTSLSESEVQKFKTIGCAATCEAPRGINISVTDATAVITWAGATNAATSFKLLVVSEDGSFSREAAVSGNILTLTGLPLCKKYKVQIKSVCSSTSYSEIVTATFETLGCPTTCERTTGLASQLISDTEVAVKFNLIAGQSYKIQYRVAGTTTWTSIALTSITANNLPVRITGLHSCTVYQWRVLRICSATNLSESEVLTFTTTGCPTPCAAPRDLLTSNYASDSAKFSWIMPTSGLKYEVRFGAATDSSFLTATSIRTEHNVVVLRGLVACRYYVAQVRTICENGTFSDWKTTVKFRVGANCLSAEPNGTQPNERVQYVSEFGIYPNPGSDFVQVAYKLENEANVKIELMNLQGQVVSRFDGGNQEVGNYIQTLDNLSNVQTGIYLVVIRANGKVVDTQKWQKQ
jgi:trimeric autotransporter adhesin